MRNGALRTAASDEGKEKLKKGGYLLTFQTGVRTERRSWVWESLFKPCSVCLTEKTVEKEKEQKCNLTWKKQERTPQTQVQETDLITSNNIE